MDKFDDFFLLKLDNSQLQNPAQFQVLQKVTQPALMAAVVWAIQIMKACFDAALTAKFVLSSFNQGVLKLVWHRSDSYCDQCAHNRAEAPSCCPSTGSPQRLFSLLPKLYHLIL